MREYFCFIGVRRRPGESNREETFTFLLSEVCCQKKRRNQTNLGFIQTFQFLSLVQDRCYKPTYRNRERQTKNPENVARNRPKKQKKVQRTSLQKSKPCKKIKGCNYLDTVSFHEIVRAVFIDLSRPGYLFSCREMKMTVQCLCTSHFREEASGRRKDS